MSSSLYDAPEHTDEEIATMLAAMRHEGGALSYADELRRARRELVLLRRENAILRADRDRAINQRDDAYAQLRGLHRQIVHSDPAMMAGG